MVIIVSGEDGWRARRKRDELVTAFRAKFDPSGMNVDLREGAALPPEELAASVRTQPFLASRRMVVVRGLLSRKGEKATDALVEALLGHDPEHLVIVLVESLAPDALAKNAVHKALIKKLPKAQLVEYLFAPLSQIELRAWANEEAARLGTRLEPAAAEALASAVGSDLWRMHSELEKLAAYRAGEVVRRGDVELLVERHLEENIFAFTDAVGSGDMRAAAAVLARELEAGSEPFGLLSMLGRQVRLLAAARSLLDAGAVAPDRFAAEFGLHPFVAKKTLAQARAFPAARVRSLHDAILTADRNIKRGRIKPEDALAELLAGCAVQK